jgi:plastocyanin
MSNETLFYILGSVLAVSAVVTSFLGLRFKAFPGRALPVVVLWFVVLIGAATTYAVLGSKDEQEAKAAELAKANEEVESEDAEAPAEPTEGAEESQPEPEAAPETGAKGPGETLQLAASATVIAYDTTSLTSKPGEVTIDFENPSAIEHDVVIKQGSKEVAASERITEGETSVSADLAPGAYTFFCSVPGHAQAGMEGTLTVK